MDFLLIILLVILAMLAVPYVIYRMAWWLVAGALDALSYFVNKNKDKE